MDGVIDEDFACMECKLEGVELWTGPREDGLFNDPLHTFHYVGGEGHWQDVVQGLGRAPLGNGMMVACFNSFRTMPVLMEVWNRLLEMHTSWSAQCLRTQPLMLLVSRCTVYLGPLEKVYRKTQKVYQEISLGCSEEPVDINAI